LKGNQKWTLYSPNYINKLYLYPYLHPHHAQSQIFPGSDEINFPKFKQAIAKTVTLSHGELLYIPPYWVHEVESLVPSININSWTKTPEPDLLKNIFMNLPFEAKDDPKLRTHKFQYYSLKLLSNLGKTKEWVWEYLINQRFQLLIQDGVYHDVSYYSDFIDPTFVISEKDKLDQLAKNNANSFKKMSIDSRDLLLANYLEGLSLSTARGNSDLVIAMIKSCFK